MDKKIDYPSSPLTKPTAVPAPTMVVVKVSRTAAINPPGVSPVLTVDQLWQGMVIKAREPQEFVALMEGCEVLEERENGLTRLVIFKEGWGPPSGKAEEEVSFHKPMRVSICLAFNSRPSGPFPLTWCRSISPCPLPARKSATSCPQTVTMTVYFT